MIFFLSLILLLTPTSKNELGMFPSSLRLCGVVVSENKSDSVAVFKKENTAKISVLRIGDSIDGFRLLHVFKNRIVLQKETNTYQIFLYGDQKSRIQPRHQKELEPVILKKEIIRSEFEIRVDKEWAQIMNETRFIPNVVEDKIRGFKLTKAAQGSILTDLGIRRNDIIIAINDTVLDSVASIYPFIDVFKTADRILLEIERKGYPMQIMYLLK